MACLDRSREIAGSIPVTCSVFTFIIAALGMMSVGYLPYQLPSDFVSARLPQVGQNDQPAIVTC